MHDDGFHLDAVRDKNVIDRHGDNVGHVVDVVIDPTSWRVSHFLVRLRRDLAPEVTGRQPALFETAPRHTFEVSSERIRTVGDNVVLDVDLREILDRLRTHERAAHGRYEMAAEADRMRFGRPDPMGVPPTQPAPAPPSVGRTRDDIPPLP